MNFYTMNYENALTILCFITSIVVVLFAQFRITSVYSKYKKITNKKNLTGSEVARIILDANKLDKIYVVETNGSLTDHYDPSRKVIKLSREIFNGNSIASLSVAAHEVGHAIQDKDGYSFMRIRSILVPFVNLISYLGYFGIIIGILAGMTGYLLIGILVLLVTILFQLITLPVEFDASKRAKNELVKLNIIDSEELNDVERVLSAAAMTYIASLISSLLNLLRLILMFTRRD